MRKQWVQQGETNKSMAPSIQQLLIRDHHSTPFSAKTGGKSVARRVLQDFGGKRMQEVAGDGTRANQAAISNLDAALGTPPLGNLPHWDVQQHRFIPESKPRQDQDGELSLHHCFYLLYTPLSYLKAQMKNKHLI